MKDDLVADLAGIKCAGFENHVPFPVAIGTGLFLVKPLLRCFRKSCRDCCQRKYP